MEINIFTNVHLHYMCMYLYVISYFFVEQFTFPGVPERTTGRVLHFFLVNVKYVLINVVEGLIYLNHFSYILSV